MRTVVRIAMGMLSSPVLVEPALAPEMNRFERGRALLLREKIRLAGREIDRKRRMLVNYQPVAVGLAQHVRHPDVELDRLAILGFAHDVLNHPRVSHLAVGDNVEID